MGQREYCFCSMRSEFGAREDRAEHRGISCRVIMALDTMRLPKQWMVARSKPLIQANNLCDTPHPTPLWGLVLESGVWSDWSTDTQF